MVKEITTKNLNKMMQIIQQTDEEKMVMYLKLPKKKIIEMLIQCNKILDNIISELNEKISQPVLISSLHSECQNGLENSDYSIERGKCNKLKLKK